MTADPWRCEACGAPYDMAARTLEAGLVRLALDGPDGFRLGSDGIEAELVPLLEPCACGGRIVPGGEAEKLGSDPVFSPEALRPLARRGWEVLEACEEPRLVRLREVWRPRALRLLGREDELSPEDVLGLRLEQRLAELRVAIDRARAAGDEDAAQMAHARYIELGTSYARRFAAR
jgi:hypothetical protein